jgi:hypothetical protein
MLGFFLQKNEHPLADPKEAKRILAEIATREPLGAAEEASGWLESIPAEQGFKPLQRLELTLRLDEATAAQSRRLARDYQPWSMVRVPRNQGIGSSATATGACCSLPISTASPGCAQGRRMPRRCGRSSICFTAG